MGGRRQRRQRLQRRRKSNTKTTQPLEEDLWNGSIRIIIDSAAGAHTLEIVGVNSPTHTAFCRLLPPKTSCSAATSTAPSLLSVIEQTIHVIRAHNCGRDEEDDSKRRNGNNCTSTTATCSADELLWLGAVWILIADNNDEQHQPPPPPSSLVLLGDDIRNVNDSSKDARGRVKQSVVSTRRQQQQQQQRRRRQRQRATVKDASFGSFFDWSAVVLRLHYSPSRFPAVYTVDWSRQYDDVFSAKLRLLDANISKNNNDKNDNDNDIDDDKCPSLLQQNNDNNLPPLAEGVIVFEDFECGYAILNKPGFVPSHATVDNQVENVLAMYQTALAKRTKSNNNNNTNEHYPYVTLPQRLDIETQGLLLVATKSEFASYIGKLLEFKSTLSSSLSSSALKQQQQLDGTAVIPPPPPPPSALCRTIKKRYKCLVHVENVSHRASLLETLSHKRKPKDNYNDTDTDNDVIHYMNPNSPAPKTFSSHPSPGWLQCVLRIVRVGECCHLRTNTTLTSTDSTVVAEMTTNLTNEREHQQQLADTATSMPNDDVVMEFEIELLTGRTHQIRGQLASMGFPIVGDPIYGIRQRRQWQRQGREAVPVVLDICQNNNKIMTTNTTLQQTMALQCCHLSFPKPVISTTTNNTAKTTTPHNNNNNNNNNNQGDETIRMCSFQLNTTWWSEFLYNFDVNDDEGVGDGEES